MRPTDVVHTGIAALTVALAALFGAAPAFAQTDPTGQLTPACRVFDAQSRPADQFGRGDQLIVRGVDFPSGTSVSVTFDQSGETTELAQVRANTNGGISTAATDTTVPSSAEPGPATIRASDGTHIAMCVITITAASAQGSGRWYFLWFVLLALFGAFLAVVGIRRWRHRKLESQIADLPHLVVAERGVWADEDDRPVITDDVERVPSEVSIDENLEPGAEAERTRATKGERRLFAKRPAKREAADEVPELEPEFDEDPVLDSDEWAYGAGTPGGPIRPKRTPRPPKQKRSRRRRSEAPVPPLVVEEEPVDLKPDDEPEVERVPVPLSDPDSEIVFEDEEDETLTEPPVLPESFQEEFEPAGPSRTSPAVTRLLRETARWTKR